MQVNSKDKNRKWVAADNAEVITSSVIVFFSLWFHGFSIVIK
jgi:hypothetical protein